MQKNAVKDLIFGGLSELIQNREYYYHSPLGAEYSHWTDAGEDVMTGFMTIMAFYIAEADAESLDERAKELVMDGLTK